MSKQTLQKKVFQKVEQDELYLSHIFCSLLKQSILLCAISVLWMARFLLRCVIVYIPAILRSWKIAWQDRKDRIAYAKTYAYGSKLKP